MAPRPVRPGVPRGSFQFGQIIQVRDLQQNKVIRSVGFLDLDLLTEIVDQFDKLFYDNSFDGWM